MGEKQDALMHELTCAVQDLTSEVRTLVDMIRPVAEAVAESGLEGDVARAVMGKGKWMISREEYEELSAALEGNGFRGGSGMFRVIKIVRAATGMGLKEAKELYDTEGRAILNLFEAK